MGQFEPNMHRCAPKASMHVRTHGRNDSTVQSGSDPLARADTLQTTFGSRASCASPAAHSRR
jgi:hypothetical protein